MYNPVMDSKRLYVRVDATDLLGALGDPEFAPEERGIRLLQELLNGGVAGVGKDRLGELLRIEVVPVGTGHALPGVVNDASGFEERQCIGQIRVSLNECVGE